jgi:hypothetical protein
MSVFLLTSTRPHARLAAAWTQPMERTMPRMSIIAAAILTMTTLASVRAADPPAPLHSDVVLLSELEGVSVYDADNNKIGHIRDIMLRDGKLDSYILSVGGVLGVGGRVIAVRPDQLILTDIQRADLCRSGGIGRRARLKIVSRKG